VDLATLLRTLRIQAGLSQQMLADRALISVQAVSALERGHRKVPYQHTLERIAEALGLPEDARAALEQAARRARGSRLDLHASSRPHNIPRQLTSFIGREDAIREIVQLVETTPLVAIVGPGGAGKTRAAIEAGMRLLERFPDGVWFVELAPTVDTSLVAHAIAGALRVQESPQRPLRETLVSHLAQKQMLLILDNCEHLVLGVRQIAGSLLRECPRVSLLATTREVLNVTGERSYQIPPLAVPVQRAPLPEEAMKYGAVALFADRARAANSRFSVTQGNVEAVVEICRRLDGLPLALELAAARATVLSPQQICARLDRAFDLLSADDASAPARHQTMRAVIDWSFALLSAQARLLFERLAVFPGGFTLETAEAVCADDRLPRGDIFELLSSLIAQSMVNVDFEHGDARYQLLEPMRQYALEKLDERGEREVLVKRSARAFVDVAQRLDREWYGSAERSWFREAAAELDNCRVALGWSLGEGNDVETGGELAATLARAWYSLSPVEGRRWVRLAMGSIEEAIAPSTLAQLYIADAELCGALGEYKASLSSARHALKSKALLDDVQTARTKPAAGSALGAIGRSAEAESTLEEALVIARRVDNRRLQAMILNELGTVRSRRGDVDGARSFYAEALAGYIALALERPAASIAGHLAEVEFAGGDAAAALHLAEEARAGHEATQNRRSVANDISNMAAYFIALDCFDDASAHAMEALHAARDVKATVLTAYVLQHCAAVAALRARNSKRKTKEMLERSAMLIGFVDARLKSLEARREYTEQQEYERVMALFREALGKRLESVMVLGAEWTEDGAVAVASEL
jgi:predicted ATPase/DNA-binding XRE family transcriptional regulator